MAMFERVSTHPYLRTRTGTKLHWDPCESTFDQYGAGQLKASVVPMTEQQAADWLAADPRRSICQRCRPRKPYGRLRAVR